MLQMQMSSTERDTLDVISYVKQEDAKKDEQVCHKYTCELPNKIVEPSLGLVPQKIVNPGLSKILIMVFLSRT